MPVDNGASQRRSLTSDGNTVVNQAQSTQPKGSSSESLAAVTFTPLAATDYGPTKFPGVGEGGVTIIGPAVMETLSSQSRSQTATKMTIDGADFGASVRRGVNEQLKTALGATPESAVQATSEMPANGGPTTPLSQAPTTYYKLLAFDSITNAPVRWVSTFKDLSNAPASPNGNPLTSPPIVEAQWTQ